MIARAATIADVDVVLACLAERSRCELDRALASYPALDRPVVVRNIFTTAINEGSCEALVADQRPLALLATEPEDDAVITSFVAVEAFFDRTHLAFTRRHVRELQNRSGRDLRSYSYSDHPSTGRWFRTIGFNECEQYGNAVRYTRSFR